MSNTPAQPTIGTAPSNTAPALLPKPVLPTSLSTGKQATPKTDVRESKLQNSTPNRTVSLSETTGVWKRYFQDWPEVIPRRGILVNRLGEQIPFKAFMVQSEVVLLERSNPDTMGARFLIVPYCEVGIVKLIDPLKQSVFEESGYQGKLSN